ncbi:MAG: YdeI/OmpD-associated family protein [Solirubrobacteraceae bacterium]|nr:YdeI/OmpD-associated family protein [Solirubrobacteraceae bacterium]
MNAARADATETRRRIANDEATFFDDPVAFRDWLEENADRSGGIWIRFAKPDSGVEGGTVAEAIDQALGFGWLETETVRDDDDRFTLLRFVPRLPDSPWSQAHRDRARELLHEGLLAPRGRREFDTAQADGRLDQAYGPVTADDIPADLASAIAVNETAQAFFDELDDRNILMMLRRVDNAPDAETRAKRIATFVDMLARGEKLYPRRPKSR